MRHLIDFGDLSREEWDGLYARAEKIIEVPEKHLDVCRGRVMGSLFYEPSTRTNFSFQSRQAHHPLFRPQTDMKA